MSRVLLISSFTADSHVGGVTSAFVLRRLGLDVTLLPTTLFGRHPGWGAPGGMTVPSEQLASMWKAVQDQIERRERGFDAVMTGYMGATAHVELAARIIDTLSPDKVLVDPVMGDGRLYIEESRAEAICDHLVPRAHIVTPNLWEWRYITGSLRDDPASEPTALTGADETLVTSYDRDGRIGARLFSGGHIHTLLHERFDDMPNGGGDAVAAAYLAHRLTGHAPGTAMQRAVSAIFAIMNAADRLDAGELPMVRAQAALADPDLLPLTMTEDA